MIIQPKHAQDPSHYYKPASSEKLTVDNTVRSPTIPAGARIAKVFFRVATVRVTLDETDPVAGSNGVTFTSTSATSNFITLITTYKAPAATGPSYGARLRGAH